MGAISSIFYEPKPEPVDYGVCCEIMKACRKGHINKAKLLLSGSNIPNYIIHDGFERACEYNRLEIINLIACSKYYDIQSINHGLMGSCKGGHLHLVEFFIQQGASNFDSALQEACSGGHLQIVELILTKGASDFDSALDNACSGGNLQIVELMLTMGANITDFTVFCACLYGRLEIVQFLVQRAHVYVDWNCMLTTVCSHRHLHMIEYIFSQGVTDINEALEDACINNRLNVVKLLMTKIDLYKTNYNRINYNRILPKMLDNSSFGHTSYTIVKLIADRCDNIKCLKKSRDVMVRILYCRKTGKAPQDDPYIQKTITKYPPYVLLLGQQCDKKCSVKKLPVELVRYLFSYFR